MIPHIYGLIDNEFHIGYLSYTIVHWATETHFCDMYASLWLVLQRMASRADVAAVIQWSAVATFCNVMKSYTHFRPSIRENGYSYIMFHKL